MLPSSVFHFFPSFFVAIKSHLRKIFLFHCGQLRTIGTNCLLNRRLIIISVCGAVSVCVFSLRALHCVSVCNLDCVFKLLPGIIVDETSTSGHVTKSAGDVNRLFTSLECLPIASYWRTPTQSRLSATNYDHTGHSNLISGCHWRHHQILVMPQNVQRTEQEQIHSCEQTNFLMLYFSHSYHIWAGVCLWNKWDYI